VQVAATPETVSQTLSRLDEEKRAAFDAWVLKYWPDTGKYDDGHTDSLYEITPEGITAFEAGAIGNPVTIGGNVFSMPSANVTVFAAFALRDANGNGTPDLSEFAPQPYTPPEEDNGGDASGGRRQPNPPLLTDKHIAYIQGYPDGSFGPEKTITRAETAMMLYRLLKDQPTEAPIGFTDIVGDPWYALAANALHELGIITGYQDGSFGANRAITRAEFTALIVRFVGAAQAGENTFPDVPQNHWAADAIATAADYGWVTGYDDGSFRPDAHITRAEAVKLINALLNRSADRAYIDANLSKLMTFPDVAEDHWAYYHILEAATAHEYANEQGAEVWGQ
jgi:hypothetical protein